MIYPALTYAELLKYSEKLCVIYRNVAKDDVVYTYSEIVNASKNLNCFLNKYEVKNHKRIGLMLGDSPALVTLILGILNHNCSFCPIDSNSTVENLCSNLKCYNASYLLTNIIFDKPDELELVQEIEVLNEKIFFYKTIQLYEPNHVLLCYSIRTSGSTSMPKIVHVPYECIVPNIEYLSQIYSITAEDVVLVASPPTFDPFVVEVFLALKNGATILIIPKSVRCCPKILADLIFPEERTGVTIIQMTPSVFKLFGTEVIQQRIFDKNSSLRILVLGGESFPDLKEVKFWQNWDDPKRKRVFNIYGITEVSCWSSIQEITNDTKEVSLGLPIDPNTILEVRDLVNKQAVFEGSGEVFIGSSTRKCVLGDESFEILSKTDQTIFRPSGDIAAQTKNGHIFYKGRKDDVVKKFGYQINLQKLGECFRELDGVEEAFCIFSRSNNLLILFYTGISLTRAESFEFLIKRFNDHEIPDDIVHVDVLPLSAHGKISKYKLLELYESRKKNNVGQEKTGDIFEQLCAKILGRANCSSAVKRSKMSWDLSFKAAGGTSFKALQLCKELEEITSKSTSEILLMLLNEDCLLSDITKEIEKDIAATSSEIRPDNDNMDLAFKTDYCKIHLKLLLSISWKYNLGKCIDASPKVKNSLVSVGSHSHILANLSLDDGQLISSIELPDRIESPVEFLEEPYAVVGCYDGFLYKFDTKKGSIAWSFNSRGMIKCKTLAIDNTVIFGNYAKDKNLFCLDSKDGTLLWNINISSKGIFSSPTKLDNTKVVICCLDGTTAVIEIKTGIILWRKQFSFPIFATCVVVGRFICVAEVNGLILFIDFEGNEIATFKAGGSIFSSFEIINCSGEKQDITFGCHDRHLYSIELINGVPRLKWRIRLPSQVFSTPKYLVINESSWIVACSTNGFVSIVQPEKGVIETQLKIGGEIFSSPCCVGNKIIVGCRDNNLYCIEINS